MDEPRRIHLDLGSGDAVLLERALGRVLHDMEAELVRTDDRKFRAALRADLDQLETIAARLAHARNGGTG